MQRLSDKRTRVNAIPFRSLWWDDSSIGNAFDEEGNITGDLRPLRTGNGAACEVRMTLPEKGDLIECRLTMQGTMPYSIGGHSLRFYIGRFQSDGITPAVLTAAEKAASWKKINGSEAWLDYGTQDNVFIDGLNLLPAMPKRGDADYNTDGFILGVDLSIKDFASEWVLYQFKVDATVQIAEVLR